VLKPARRSACVSDRSGTRCTRNKESIIYDKLRLGLPVSDDDVRHLHDIYARRHHQLVASSLAYHWPCHRHD
jgi:hypothetical protein